MWRLPAAAHLYAIAPCSATLCAARHDVLGEILRACARTPQVQGRRNLRSVALAPYGQKGSLPLDEHHPARRHGDDLLRPVPHIQRDALLRREHRREGEQLAMHSSEQQAPAVVRPRLLANGPGIEAPSVSSMNFS